MARAATHGASSEQPTYLEYRVADDARRINSCPRITDRAEVLSRGGTPDALGFAPGQNAIGSRATEMPGALVELLFISNTEDAALLRSDAARDAMARGVARGILVILGQERPGG